MSRTIERGHQSFPFFAIHFSHTFQSSCSLHTRSMHGTGTEHVHTCTDTNTGINTDENTYCKGIRQMKQQGATEVCLTCHAVISVHGVGTTNNIVISTIVCVFYYVITCFYANWSPGAYPIVVGSSGKLEWMPDKIRTVCTATDLQHKTWRWVVERMVEIVLCFWATSNSAE